MLLSPKIRRKDRGVLARSALLKKTNLLAAGPREEYRRRAQYRCLPNRPVYVDPVLYPPVAAVGACGSENAEGLADHRQTQGARGQIRRT
jgi:hypothetical protein